MKWTYRFIFVKKKKKKGKNRSLKIISSFEILDSKQNQEGTIIKWLETR